MYTLGVLKVARNESRRAATGGVSLIEGTGEGGRTRGLLIAAASLALLWTVAFLKGRVKDRRTN